MSKSKNQNHSSTTTTETTTETTAENVSKAEIVTTSPTTPQVLEEFNWQAYKETHPKTMVHLYPQLPHLLKKLKGYEKPDESDLKAAMEDLNATERKQFENLLDTLNPDKDGVELGPTGIRPKLIKLFQGTGTDPLRHEDCPIGGFYIQGDRILTALPGTAKSLKLPPFFTGIIIGLYKGNIYFAKERNGTKEYPPGVPPTNGPICYSKDQIRGTRWSSCAQCPYRPQNGKEQACGPQVDLFIMMPDFSGIYLMQVSSTSIPTAITPIQSHIANWRTAYECVFRFEAKERTHEKNRWFVNCAKVHTSEEEPMGVKTTVGQRAIARYFSRLLYCEKWLPELAATYTADYNYGNNGTNSLPSSASEAVKAAQEDLVDNRNNV